MTASIAGGGRTCGLGKAGIDDGVHVRCLGGHWPSSASRPFKADSGTESTSSSGGQKEHATATPPDRALCNLTHRALARPGGPPIAFVEPVTPP